MFQVQTSLQDKTLIFTLLGSLDIGGVDTFENEVSKVDLLVADMVHIDFKGVEFVDSTGIGSIVNLVQSLEERGLGYKLTNVSEPIQEVFVILGLEDIIR